MGLLLSRVVMASIVIGLFISFPMKSQAYPLILNGFASQTETGQFFAFDFNSIPHSSNSNAVLSIHARGDYADGNPNEYLAWSIDSLSFTKSGPYYGASWFTHDPEYSDIEFTQSFTITNIDMLSLTSDRALSVYIDIADGSSPRPNSFVEFSLQYDASPVPIPGAVWLLGSGLVGLVGLRKRFVE